VFRLNFTGKLQRFYGGAELKYCGIVSAFFHIWFFLIMCFLIFLQDDFYARKQLLLSARLSHRNCLSVRLSVRLSVTRVDQSKTMQARITKSSPSSAWKTLVSGSVKHFHKFGKGLPERQS